MAAFDFGALFQCVADSTPDDFIIVWLEPLNAHSWRKAEETHHEVLGEILPGITYSISQMRFDMRVANVPRIAENYAMMCGMLPFLPSVEVVLPSIIATLILNVEYWEDLATVKAVMGPTMLHKLGDVREAAAEYGYSREKTYWTLVEMVSEWVFIKKHLVVKRVFPEATAAWVAKHTKNATRQRRSPLAVRLSKERVLSTVFEE